MAIAWAGTLQNFRRMECGTGCGENPNEFEVLMLLAAASCKLIYMCILTKVNVVFKLFAKASKSAATELDLMAEALTTFHPRLSIFIWDSVKSCKGIFKDTGQSHIY